MTETSPPAWGGDPSIAWRILLRCAPRPALTLEELTARQLALHRAQGWPDPPAVVTGEAGDVERAVAEVRDVPLVLGLAGDQLVISAFHAYVDGLGLLDVLAALSGEPVASSARGVGDRAVGGGGIASRLREVAFAPPATVSPPAIAPSEGDAFAAVVIGGQARTSDLVHASVAAVVAHNAARGRTSRHVAIAVGAGRPAAAGEKVANRSELIRLRDVEALSRPELESALRTAPLSAGGGSGVGGGRLAAYALRVLAPRLGSTLLVSHLGDVTTSAAAGLAFYPVTAGGTGLSLGAVAHDGTTVLTLRGRASAWDSNALLELLGRVVESLGSRSGL